MEEDTKSQDTMKGFEFSADVDSKQHSLSYYFDRFTLNSRTTSKDFSRKEDKPLKTGKGFRSISKSPSWERRYLNFFTLLYFH